MKKEDDKKGFLAAVISSATFGVMPLLSKQVMNNGVPIETIMSYRYFTGASLLFFLLLYRHSSFRISRRQAVEILFLGACYPAVTSLLMVSYGYLSTGISTSLHFLYPIPVALIMIFAFKENFSFPVLVGIVVSILGVFVLSFNGEVKISPRGILLVLLADIIYAVYIVLLNKLSVRLMSGMVFTFYILLAASFYSFTGGFLQNHLQWIFDGHSLLMILLLAVFSTVVSNVALVEAVKKIGSTLTAIFGTMEPLVAVLLGLFFFNEPFSFRIGLGIVLVLSAVVIIIISDESKRTLQGRLLYSKLIRLWIKNKKK